MIDFGLAGPQTSAPAVVEVRQQAPVQVTQEVVTAPADSAASAYLLRPAREWSWQDLRDYVITSAEQRFGPQVRDPKKEAGIFKGFVTRHGIENAVLVAVAAFEVYEGLWCSAPVHVQRFCKNSDPYFSDVILSRLKG